MNILIGDMIKKLRKEKGLSQEELCGECLNRVVLSRIENNKMLPSIPQLQYISKKLGVSIIYFFIDNYDEIFYNNCSILQKENHILKTLYLQKDYYSIVKLKETYGNNILKYKDCIMYFYLGISYFNLNMFNDALTFLKKYINNYVKSDKSYQEINLIYFSEALNTLFKIMLKYKNYSKGESYLCLAIKYLDFYNKMNSRISYIVHNNLSFIYLQTCQFEKIIKIMEEFLDKYNNLNYIDIIPDIYISLNIAAYNIEQYEKSIKYAKKAIQAFLYLDDEVSAGSCYLNYINALRYSGNIDEAFSILNFCKKEFNNVIVINKLLYEEMILYFNLNEYKKVQNVFKEIKNKNLPFRFKYNIYFMLGHINYLNGNYSIALKYLKNCENYFTSRNYSYDLIIIYHDLFEITKDEIYKIKENEYNNISGRKNILNKLPNFCNNKII